jgi:hypothetical protein
VEAAGAKTAATDTEGKAEGQAVAKRGFRQSVRTTARGKKQDRLDGRRRLKACGTGIIHAGPEQAI